MEVTIGRRGAIIFPHNLCVDGHENGCIYRFVTHIHADHIIDVDKSIAFSRHVIGTPITLELLKAMGYTIPQSKSLALNYGQSMDLNSNGFVRLRVHEADHIPGAAQVVLEMDGLTVGYTGDFRNPGSKTAILKDLDILIIDATYGDPSYVRESEEAIMSEFVKLLKRLLSYGPVAIYAYHGKINDIMIKLRAWGIDAPYILPWSQWNIYMVLSRYGYSTTNVYLDATKEAEEVKRTQWYIEFNLTSKLSYMKRRRGISHIVVTGRYGKKIMRMGDAWDHRFKRPR
uniref:MBL fold metallo-hydrolase n=1 Tax=Ignisphaera aggregans TaxID=334771 RepID=A0A7C2VLM0_9CREN